MNDISIFAVGGFQEVDGVMLHLTPLAAIDYAEARAFVRSLSPDPLTGIVEICNQLHPDVAKVLIADAHRSRESWGSLTEGPGLMWAGGWDGQAYWLFKTSRQFHPDITMEWCKAAIIKMTDEQRNRMSTTIAEISGLLKNPTKTPQKKRKVKRKQR